MMINKLQQIVTILSVSIGFSVSFVHAGKIADNNLTVAVAWKQTAAEYKALYYQGFNLAAARVKQALAKHQAGDKPLAVITDIDDTILSAVNYWGYLIKNHQDFFDDSIWDRWVPGNHFLAQPGAKAFLDFCQQNKVEVFYVSSRDQGKKTTAYALANLKALKFPYIDKEHVTVLRDTSNKAPRQNAIREKYKVVVMLGDSLNDYKRKYAVKDVAKRTALMQEDKADFGNQFILFPNPTDGHWVRAIFGASEPKATDDNRVIYQKAATTSSWDGQSSN